LEFSSLFSGLILTNISIFGKPCEIFYVRKVEKEKKKSPAGFLLCNFATWLLKIMGCQSCKGWQKVAQIWSGKKRKLKSPELDHSF
jgi:hypothetical protein